MQCTTIKFQKQSSWTQKGDQKAKGSSAALGGVGAAKSPGLMGGTAPPGFDFVLARPCDSCLFSTTFGTIRLWGERNIYLPPAGPGWQPSPLWVSASCPAGRPRYAFFARCTLASEAIALTDGLRLGPRLLFSDAGTARGSAGHRIAPCMPLCFVTHFGASACERRRQLQLADGVRLGTGAVIAAGSDERRPVPLNFGGSPRWQGRYLSVSGSVDGPRSCRAAPKGPENESGGSLC